jgi:hypothetical protein
MITDYEVIESHIQRARLERSVFLAECIAGGIVALTASLDRLAAPLLRRSWTWVERAWLGCLAYLP